DADPTGTIPHSLVLMIGDTVEALKAFHDVIDPKVRRVALIDTLQDEKFEAIRVAQALGRDLYAVRLDTPSSRRGDFYRIIEEVRWELGLRGFGHVKILASGGIDEYEILALNPVVDGYGVGTSIANAPVLNFALDIMEIEGQPMAKRGKWSGAKDVFRRRGALETVVLPAGQRPPGPGGAWEPLLKPLVAAGRIVRDLPPPRTLRGAGRLVAEVKKASPSRGVLAPDLDPQALARTYAAGGAHAISVLTDEKYFQGSLDLLGRIRGAVEVPLLRKDFTIDEYQLWEARAAGADAVLLIIAILEPPHLRDLGAAAKGLGLAALVECHTAAEVDAALAAGARIIGINNRDLRTFETRIETTLELLPRIPPGPIVVSESGFVDGAQVRRVVAAGAHAILVGEGLVTAGDVRARIRELTCGEPSP